MKSRAIKAAASKPPRKPKPPKNGYSSNGNGTHPTSALNRILRNQASFRWILPSLRAITPNYIETTLRGALAGNHIQQWELLTLMLDSWPVLASCKTELEYGVTRRDIVFDPYSEEDKMATPSAIEREKLVTCAFDNMNPDPTMDENDLEGTIKDLMDGWFKGVSVLEILWDTCDTENQGTIWCPKSTYWVNPVSYAWSSEGVLGLTDPNAPQGYGITNSNPRQATLTRFPENKFLIGINKIQSGNPLGGPLLRPLAWWWCAANFSSDWLLNLAQVFGLPFRWASYAAATPDETVSIIGQMLANMGSAGWAAFPEGTTMELKESTMAHSGHTPQGDLLDRADSYARTLLLGQTMTGQTIASGRGGQAFGTVEAQLKQDRLDAACDYIANIINRQFIPAILMFNYGDKKEAPCCRFLQETIGTYQDAQRDQVLANMGIPIPFSHMRQKYAIPEPTGDEEVTEKQLPPTPVGSDGKPAPAGPKGTSPIDKKPDPNAPKKKPGQTPVESKLEEISQIEDEATFTKAVLALASEIIATTKEPS